MSLRLDWCSHDAVVYACKNWHYSKSIPVPPLVKIGVWENEKYIGCVLFSRGASSNIGKPYKLNQTEICELTRVALNSHDSEVTRIVAIAMKMMFKQNPKLKLIVSYADPNQGHEGTIYKAGNWIYQGKTKPTKKYIDKNGREYHSRQVSKTGITTQFGNKRMMPKIDDLEVIHELPKHKFIYPLDKDWYNQYCVSSEKVSRSTSVENRRGSTDPDAPTIDNKRNEC